MDPNNVHITFTMNKIPANCVSTTGRASDAPIQDKGSDRSKDQPEPQNACFLPQTKMLAKRLRSFGFVVCALWRKK